MKVAIDIHDVLVPLSLYSSAITRPEMEQNRNIKILRA